MSKYRTPHQKKSVGQGVLKVGGDDDGKNERIAQAIENMCWKEARTEGNAACASKPKLKQTQFTTAGAQS